MTFGVTVWPISHSVRIQKVLIYHKFITIHVATSWCTLSILQSNSNSTNGRTEGPSTLPAKFVKDFFSHAEFSE